MLEQLGTESAVLLIDATGFPKRGQKSAGVAMQYCGSSGQHEASTLDERGEPKGRVSSTGQPFPCSIDSTMMVGTCLVIHRDIADPHEKRYYFVFAPPGTSLSKTVNAIGARWHIEEGARKRQR